MFSHSSIFLSMHHLLLLCHGDEIETPEGRELELVLQLSILVSRFCTIQDLDFALTRTPTCLLCSSSF